MDEVYVIVYDTDIIKINAQKRANWKCPKCGFTELYKANTSSGMNILDFLMN